MFKNFEDFKPAEIDPRTKQAYAPKAQGKFDARYGAEIEEKILKFWQENKIFEKSLKRGPIQTERGPIQAERRPVREKTKKCQLKDEDYVFYDGPPFANGLPHYGHILASIIKDVIPRYQTMKGKKVERRWGWDCHGLPVEFEIEKELGLETKKDIERFGIEKFNEFAKKSVLKYEADWKKIIPRIGRWVDMENAYKTMDVEYMESVLWIFKSLYKKELIYEGYKSMHICPRCETTLSNFEVSLGYKNTEDASIIVKFLLSNFPNTYLLAWTTTPWTLPANVALAINPSYQYVKIKINNEYFILAKERLSVVNSDYQIIEKIKTHKLINLTYKPIFDYYSKNKNLKNRENGWRVYPANFVTIKEGTGVVHIAPAFGAEDMELAQKHKLPFIQHVSLNGGFENEVSDFAGLSVKPKENPLITDRKIIEWLRKNNKLFKEELITHSYPHCWRCETPLLNYAASSWFVKVAAIKNQLIRNNKKINWIPKHIKVGRFGKWLEDARDWAISRNRFWGTPLPAWKCEKCDQLKIVGSIEEIKRNTKKSGNKYFVMRHGEAENNLFKIISSNYKNKHHLTEKGKKEIINSLKKLKKIDLIFSSDFIRAKETAQIAAQYFKIKKVIYDKRLREINTGIFEGKNEKEYHSYFSSLEEKFFKVPPKGENLTELKRRVSEFLYEIDQKYSNKNILIISHEYPIWMLVAGAIGADIKKSLEIKGKKENFVKTGQVKTLNFSPLPHNQNFELDLHRPYIDKIEFTCSHLIKISDNKIGKSSKHPCGGKMRRIEDVFDCWFESGSMPYAQAHYPFKQHLPFPAEFIAEGIDQTRGWFYTLLVLSTALFNKPAYKNVITNGIILAETGQKMSKRLKNYPDPMEIISKYGADSLRFYLLASPAVTGESLNFSEKGVDEIYKKVVLRLWNVYKFYELYADNSILETPNVPNINKNFRTSDVQKLNILDQWILARLEGLKQEISRWLDKYELDRAVQPAENFIDDLSTWYIRRSRERFTARGLMQTEREPTQKELEQDKQSAISTTKFVLLELSKIIAPFMPFISEAIYQRLTTNDQQPKIKSVHLEKWPKINKNLIDKKLLETMAEVRKIASLALEARARAGIKVRQPLATLKIQNTKSEIRNNKELLKILTDEINVKKIVFDNKAKGEIELDTEITPELRQEGILRELTRIIQDLRKKAGYIPKDKIYLWLEAPEEIKSAINKHFKGFQEKIGAKNIEFRRHDKFNAEEEAQIDNQKIWIGIKKV